MYPHGLYGAGMHDYVIREIELGSRAAMCEDAEACGDNALFDISYLEYLRTHPQPYPTFDDNPADWGLAPQIWASQAEADAAESLELWGPNE